MNKVIVFNHKMYMDFYNVKSYIDIVKDKIRTDIDVIICPSAIYIPYFRGKYNFKLGSQNVSGINVTGEYSATQLKSLDAFYSIVGHSERRINLNETNNLINLKVKSLVDNNMIPILCVGETIEEKEMKKTQDVIMKQLKEALRGVNVSSNLIIAYEPVWAIGTGLVPSNKEITEIVDMIKDVIYRVHNVKVRVLYGGSVNELTIKKLSKITCIDGFLIGKASVYPDKAIKILESLD